MINDGACFTANCVFSDGRKFKSSIVPVACNQDSTRNKVRPRKNHATMDNSQRTSRSSLAAGKAPSQHQGWSATSHKARTSAVTGTLLL